MGATLIVDDPELAPVLSGTHLPTSEGWNAELAQEREEVGGLLDMTSTGNRIRVIRMVAQWFTNYATAAYNPTPSLMAIDVVKLEMHIFATLDSMVVVNTA